MPLVRIGVVLSSFGVHGDMKCAYTTDHPEWIAGRKAYVLLDPRTGEAQTLHPLSVNLRDDHFTIRFAEFDAPEQLKPFSGWELGYYAKRGELPRDEPGEVYLFELAGLEVRDEQGAVLGHVSDILDTGPQFLLELDSPGRPLIPYMDRFVPEVNLEQGYLVSSYPLSPAQREEVPGGGAVDGPAGEKPRHHARRRPRSARGPSKEAVKARNSASRKRP